MPGSEKRLRTQLVAVRFSPDEAARLGQHAERAGITVGSYVRSIVLAAPVPRQARRPPVELELLGKALAQLGKVGSNLNQIARHLNSGGSGVAPELSDALAELVAAKGVLMSALGRGGDDH